VDTPRPGALDHRRGHSIDRVRNNPHHAVTDPAVVRRLIDENPWATLVSRHDDELVASHYPVLLEERDDGALSVVSHVGRPDETLHGLGSAEVLLIVAGPNGYVSPSWYGDAALRISTWNFSVAHCYGTPEILTDEENLAVLTRLVDRFESRVEKPEPLDPELGAEYAPGTVGFRLVITRFTCKVKMSADEDPQTQRQVLAELRSPGPYFNPRLADDMERALREAHRR
jgi:transcriptional regulator